MEWINYLQSHWHSGLKNHAGNSQREGPWAESWSNWRFFNVEFGCSSLVWLDFSLTVKKTCLCELDMTLLWTLWPLFGRGSSIGSRTVISLEPFHLFPQTKNWLQSSNTCFLGQECEPGTSEARSRVIETNANNYTFFDCVRQADGI